MVSLTDVQSSNSRIASTFPAGLVAVFVGATSGIGETSLKQFARYALKPQVYFVGRSQEAGDRIAAECKALNPEGSFIFIKADTSLISNVDDVCRDIKSKVTAINILFMSQGGVKIGTETSEQMHYIMAVGYYGRIRFAVNLLPLLRQATGLRRVVTVGAAGKEGVIYSNDFQGRKIPLSGSRGQFSSMLTLSLETLARKAPDVSFIHNFPGSVKTNLIRSDDGALMQVAKYVFKVATPFMSTHLSVPECGERHVFLCTSARYPAGTDAAANAGVPLAGEVAVARGVDGKIGSGVYSVDWHGDSSEPKVEERLAKFRKEGMVEKLWEHTEGEFKRISGVEAV